MTVMTIVSVHYEGSDGKITELSSNPIAPCIYLHVHQRVNLGDARDCPKFIPRYAELSLT